MHHFSKHFKKKLWFHLILPVGSALVTVAVLDILGSFSWMYKNYEDGTNYDVVPLTRSYLPGWEVVLNVMSWVFVAYRVTLSLILCVGGIFMGPRLVVLTWLGVSMMVDLIHLSETMYIFSRPVWITSWPIFFSMASNLWGECRIVRVKYRILRRTISADWIQIAVTSESKAIVDGESCESERSTVLVVNFIKLVRNLYNLLTWHLTGFIFGGNYYNFLSSNQNAMFLERNVIRHIRVFMDTLALVYILQENKVLLLTPWVTLYIITFSSLGAACLFLLIYFNLLTALLMGIYYIVLSVDLFFRLGFFFYCIRIIMKRRELI